MDKATAHELFALLEARGDPVYDDFIPVFTVRMDATASRTRYEDEAPGYRIRVGDAAVASTCTTEDWLFVLSEADRLDVDAAIQNSGIELT